MSKKESYWFSHDSDAANNPRLVALIDKYGFEGYGRWWRLLERLRSCDGYRYDTGTAFAWAVLGKDLMLTAAEAEAFVHDCINYFGVLQYDGQYLWSDSLLDRMEFWEKKREVLRERGRKGGEKSGKSRSANKNEAQVQDNEPVLQKSEAQVSKVMNILSTNEANDTKPNQTKPNQTTLYNREDKRIDDEVNFEVMENDTAHTDNSPEQENGLSILRDRALADDQRFVYAYVSTGRINKAQLADWLTAFNTWLQFTGEDIKEERDYRRHFAAWFRYRDVTREDPRQYSPATAGSTTKTELPAAAKTVPLPVAKSLLKETQMAVDDKEGKEEKNKPAGFQLKLETDTRGKYSKGDNKFDMYWLKSLRDEVRSMGG